MYLLWLCISFWGGGSPLVIIELELAGLVCILLAESAAQTVSVRVILNPCRSWVDPVTICLCVNRYDYDIALLIDDLLMLLLRVLACVMSPYVDYGVFRHHQVLLLRIHQSPFTVWLSKLWILRWLEIDFGQVKQVESLFPRLNSILNLGS